MTGRCCRHALRHQPDAGVRRVAVTDGHAAVDLRDGEAPLAELAQRTTITTVRGEVVQRVLVLGEDEQLHLWVVEDVVVRKDFPQLHQLRFDLASLQGAGVFDELAEPLDLFAECDWID